MKKLKTALVLASALFGSAAQAQWETNWLVGASGGYHWLSGGSNYYQNFNNLVTSFNGDVSNRGWMLGLLGGYQARCNVWLVGAELNVDWYDHEEGTNTFAFTDRSNRGVVATNHFKRDTVVGLTGRLAYELASSFWPYLRAGVETSRDKLHSTVGFPIANIAADASGSHRNYRFVGGVGAEWFVPMVSGLSVRGEYDYHAKGHSVSAGALASDNLTWVQTSAKPHAQSGRLSLVWNFM